MRKNAILLDRDDMSDFERELYLKDVQRVNEEYFECDKNPSLEITRTEDGFLVCVIFSTRRIKSLKHPI